MSSSSGDAAIRARDPLDEFFRDRGTGLGAGSSKATLASSAATTDEPRVARRTSATSCAFPRCTSFSAARSWWSSATAPMTARMDTESGRDADAPGGAGVSAAGTAIPKQSATTSVVDASPPLDRAVVAPPKMSRPPLWQAAAWAWRRGRSKATRDQAAPSQDVQQSPSDSLPDSPPNRHKQSSPSATTEWPRRGVQGDDWDTRAQTAPSTDAQTSLQTPRPS